ncbi:MAG: ATP-grasp domain-containing protein [Deltaproteobacteria bacterium]|nr:ATP-grasp domain-containing protein [Deltaproteobacteria bacterium]
MSLTNVMIAGIAGASLGTEILKCLLLARRYTVFGCDISPFAYGHYHEGFQKSFVVKQDSYIDSVLNACIETNCEFIIPGGEEPSRLLCEAKDTFETHGVRIAMNSPDLIRTSSDKISCFKSLCDLGFSIPETREVHGQQDLDDMPFPCIIKPATGSGGSVFVFLARNIHEASIYVQYLIDYGKTPLAQEYISHDEGEFTIGVLSLSNGHIACSIALRRLFNSKLSVLFLTEYGLISSGYSQGIIDDFSEFRKTAEAIASAFKSTGPLNVQGRVRNGVFLPFEINPRFSASTYLRAMAGVNEVDIYLQHLAHGTAPETPLLRPGFYLRSLTETFVPSDMVKS